MGKKGYDKMKPKGLRARLSSTSIIIFSLLTMPSTLILFFGMMPTIVIAAFYHKNKGTKALTVGAMNLAACTPFVLHLVLTSYDLESALIITTNPLNISVMWAGAVMGYLIDWALSGMVAIFVIELAKGRLKEIEKIQKKLVTRWGNEVTGKVPLDEEGFPIEIVKEEA